MGKYSDAKSKYIKDKIKKANWKEDKDNIDHLIFLENYILGKEKMSWAGSFILNSNKKEYNKILKELKPELYNKLALEEKREREEEIRENDKFEKEEKKLKELDKKDWIKAGGLA